MKQESSLALENNKEKSFEIFDQIAPRYDFTNRVLTGGIDLYWRKRLLSKLPKRKGLKVMDLACGTGDLALKMIESPQVAQVVGVDMSEQMLECAYKRAWQTSSAHKLAFYRDDGTQLALPDNSFDVVTLSFGIRNMPSYEKCLQEIYRVLKPHGRLLLLEFSLPNEGITRNLYLTYLRRGLPVLGGLLSRRPRAYKYLNNTIESFPTVEHMEGLFQRVGLSAVKSEKMTKGIVTLYSGDKLPH